MKEIKGCLIELFKKREFEYIVHGCNCFWKMGAGIALQLSKEFPKILEVDKQTPYGNITKLGTFRTIETPYGAIINMYTQYNYGIGEKVDYEAIEKGFKTLNDYLPVGSKIGIPKIGAGLAGGDWEKIKNIIESVTPNLDITVVVL